MKQDKLYIKQTLIGGGLFLIFIAFLMFIETSNRKNIEPQKTEIYPTTIDTKNISVEKKDYLIQKYREYIIKNNDTIELKLYYDIINSRPTMP